MATLADLQARLEALRQVRATGRRRVEYGGGSVEFRSDAELAAAIADIERQIATATGARPGPIYFNISKGV